MHMHAVKGIINFENVERGSIPNFPGQSDSRLALNSFITSQII